MDAIKSNHLGLRISDELKKDLNEFIRSIGEETGVKVKVTQAIETLLRRGLDSSKKMTKNN